MKRALILTAAALGISACSSAHPTATIPSLSGSGDTHAHGGYSPTRVSQLHAAAQCIRSHGVPSYQDRSWRRTPGVHRCAQLPRPQQGRSPRAIRDRRNPPGVRQPDRNRGLPAVRRGAGATPARPGGVRAAGCLRANGLPNYRDPTSASAFTPGHGFGITADELPNNGALGKQDPAVQRAFTACRSLLDEEIRQSDLTHLGHD